MGTHIPEAGCLEALAEAGEDPNEIFRTLASPRCRQVLALLHASDGAVPLDAAAPRLAAHEFGTVAGDNSDETAEQVLVSLYHVNAPKLDDAGLVDFEPEELTIAITEAGAQLEGMPFLPSIEE